MIGGEGLGQGDRDALGRVMTETSKIRKSERRDWISHHSERVGYNAVVVSHQGPCHLDEVLSSLDFQVCTGMMIHWALAGIPSSSEKILDSKWEMVATKWWRQMVDLQVVGWNKEISRIQATTHSEYSPEFLVQSKCLNKSDLYYQAHFLWITHPFRVHHIKWCHV